jgi:hypothetical protein
MTISSTFLHHFIRYYQNQKYDALIYLKALKDQIYDLRDCAKGIDKDFKVD